MKYPHEKYIFSLYAMFALEDSQYNDAFQPLNVWLYHNVSHTFNKECHCSWCLVNLRFRDTHQNHSITKKFLVRFYTVRFITSDKDRIYSHIMSIKKTHSLP